MKSPNPNPQPHQPERQRERERGDVGGWISILVATIGRLVAHGGVGGIALVLARGEEELVFELASALTSSNVATICKTREPSSTSNKEAQTDSKHD